MGNGRVVSWVGQNQAYKRHDTKKGRDFLIPSNKSLQLVLLFWSTTASYDQTCHMVEIGSGFCGSTVRQFTGKSSVQGSVAGEPE